MKRKFKLIVPSFLTLIFCLLLIAGSTFAIFSSQDEASIAVKSGKIEVSATITELAAFSAEASDTVLATDLNYAGEATAFGVTSKYKYVNATQLTDGYKFVNGGTAKLTNTKALSLDKLTPGDKVTAKIALVNSSNVDIKYRAKVNLVSGLKLFEALQIKLNGVLLQGVSKVGTWTYLSAPQLDQIGDPIDNMTDITFEIVLPINAGNVYQDLSTKVNFTVEAVQGNAKTEDETLNTNIEVTEAVEKTGNTVLEDEAGLVKATVPAEALNTIANTITLSVKPTDSEYNIVTTSETAAQAYDVKVLIGNTQNSAIKVDNVSEIQVNMFIGKNLKGVKLYHNGVEMASTAWNYDSETGIISFVTNSFSEYAVTYNKDLVVENSAGEFTVYEATEEQGVYEVSEDVDVSQFYGVYAYKSNEATKVMSLEAFRDSVNAGNSYTGYTVKLLDNIDLANNEWTPIGTSTNPFSGIFDGQGYTIKNFKISSEFARGEDGLFGFVIGDLNQVALDMDARWNDSAYSFNAENLEPLYKAVVKNLKISGATVSSPHADNKTDEDTYGEYGTKQNRKSTAIAIGLLRVGYAENIVVDNSTVNGYKTVGGVVGSLDGGSINNCKTTNSVIVNGYSNVGGIIGGLESANSGSNAERHKRSIISNCENNATINKITNDKAYGYIGGIIGTAQNDSCAVLDCIVNGIINSTNNGTAPNNGSNGAVGGIVGQTGAGGYFINCTNNATMIITGSHGYVGGITEYAGSSKVINCVNNANITANAIQLSGIVAGALSKETTYVSCVNNGTLVNTGSESAVTDIASSNGVAQIKDQTFATVAKLQEALNAQNLENCTNIKLINVTVTDTSGALSIPNSVQAISSDKKVCNTISLGSDRTRGINVQLPGLDYTYDYGNVIWFNIQNGSVTVPSNITVSSLSVEGANSVTIYGTVNGNVGVRDVATVTNNGSIGSISFSGTSNATFINNGSVTGCDSSYKAHSVCTQAEINLTVNNRGSIVAGEGEYALLFYGNSTVVFNAYAGSTISKANNMGVMAASNGPTIHAKCVTFNVASGADGVQNNAYYGIRAYNSTTYTYQIIINLDVELN